MKGTFKRWVWGGRAQEGGSIFAPRRICGASGRRGVVLIAVLWCCAIVMWAGLQISAQTRLMGEDQMHSLIATRALYLAIGGCYEALARMGQSQALQGEQASDQNWAPDGKPRIVVYNTGIAAVIMESDDQKINVNTAGAEQLRKVLEKAGADGQTAQMLAGRIADFVNSQTAPQLQGQAGGGLGGSLAQSSSGFGGPLTTLDQLLLVPGVSQELFYGYQTGMQQWSRQSSDLEGMAIPAVNSLFSQLTTQSGNAGMQQGLQSLQNLPGGQGPSLTQNTWAVGGTYRILSFGKCARGLPSVGVCLTVRLQGGGDAPYMILSRRIL